MRAKHISRQKSVLCLQTLVAWKHQRWFGEVSFASVIYIFFYAEIGLMWILCHHREAVSDL